MTEMCIEMQHFSVFVYSMARSELALHTLGSFLEGLLWFFWALCCWFLCSLTCWGEFQCVCVCVWPLKGHSDKHMHTHTCIANFMGTSHRCKDVSTTPKPDSHWKQCILILYTSFCLIYEPFSNKKGQNDWYCYTCGDIRASLCDEYQQDTHTDLQCCWDCDKRSHECSVMSERLQRHMTPASRASFISYNTALSHMRLVETHKTVQ